MNQLKILQSIGLEEKEAKIYLSLLEVGSATVQELAKNTGIKRPTVYVIVDQLLEKGYVVKEMKGKKALFHAEHPKKLQVDVEQRLESLNTLLPQLESLMHADEQPRVLVYEGKDRLDQAFDDFFETQGEILYIGNLSLAQEVFKRSYEKLSRVTYTEQFQVRQILDESPASREYKDKNDGPFHVTRFMPKELLPFEVDVSMFQDKTIITSVKGGYFAVSLQSEHINRAFRSMFEVMWMQLGAKNS